VRKREKVAISLIVLVVLSLAVTMPALAQVEGGRVMKADLSGVITVQREDGTTQTIDYEGTLRAGFYRKRIVIDIIDAGVIRETGEPVTVTSREVGTFQREGNRIRFNTAGTFSLERESGGRIVIDIIDAGIVTQSGRNIVIDIIHAGVVQGTGENVRIRTSGTGEMYTGDVQDGTDLSAPAIDRLNESYAYQWGSIRWGLR